MRTNSFRNIPRTEIIISSILFGFIFMVGLFNFRTLISRAKSAEAQVQLEKLYQAEKWFLYRESRYSGCLKEIGFAYEKLVSQGGPGHYKIEVTIIEPSGFVGYATSITDFDGDGIYNQWKIDHDKNLQELVKD